MELPRPPELARNPITLLGSVLAVMAVGGLAFVFAVQFLRVEPNPYVGILALIGLPAALIFGLILIPAGMVWEARRRTIAARHGKGIPPALQLDFGNPRHLTAVMGFAMTTVVILGILGATGFRAVEFMDSPTFCGTLCHTAMEPQYEPYKRSAHAEVKCAACHIGPGASWYVQSKMSGLRQVIAVITNSFPRPIPAPIGNLRPARATCEGCHWREQAYGLFLTVYRSYLPDEQNTAHVRALAFRVGTGGSMLEEAGGVHWHTSALLWYRSADKERQLMGWVGLETPEGTREWVNPNVAPGTELEERRLMDCIDCHNRAAHKIPAPNDLIDDALATGRMDPELPYLKREALRLLGEDGSTPDAQELVARWSQDGWFEQLEQFYEERYPELALTKKKSISEAIEEMKRISELVVYPDMKTTWLTYPDNRGHPGLEGASSGCFRCHGTLVSADAGEPLAGGLGGSGCLNCHGFDEEAEKTLGGDDAAGERGCALCHVRIPLEELERPLPIR